MDVLILIGSFAVVCLLGMPVAYALGLAAILAALWIGMPLEAVMLKVSGGMSSFSLLAIPFFILCRRDHGGRRHGRAAGQPRQGLRRLHPRRHGARQHPRLDHVRLHLGLVGRRHRRGRLGDDPADDQERLSAPVRRQRHDFRLAAAAAAAALAQHDHLFDRRRRHRLGRAPVHGRRHSGAAARALADHPRAHHRAPGQFPEGRGRPAAAGAQDRARCGLGHDHDRDHPRRHPLRRLHADRIRRRSPASMPSSSPCSSIATASGATCRS